MPYLVRLGNRLQRGLADWDVDRRDRHRQFLLSFQQPDGGFTGREGDSDLYYTSFGVRGLMMLGGMEEQLAESVGDYLRSLDWRTLGVIDLMNWLATALAVQVSNGCDLLANEPATWREEAAARLEAVRTSDGGYAKSPDGASGSTYHTFLVVLSYQLLGLPVPRRNALVQFLYDRQRDDGGFVEIGPMRRAGTNPTAAAAALLQEFGAVDEELRHDLRGFLKTVRGDEGGLQANSRVPFADSLSTFTGLLTIRDLSLGPLLDPERVRDWVQSQLEFPTGGFRAASWDSAADVEYTFYGLGLLALLAELEAGR
ncbi:MAG: terpene cyclase/mutase family protein [Planctomycetaceae bacterium]|nr:terpene cyclase/mutase family protein [Planctomycetaceae bacterium]